MSSSLGDFAAAERQGKSKRESKRQSERERESMCVYVMKKRE